jgi:hypothetical protein
MIGGSGQLVLSYYGCYLSAQPGKNTLEWNRDVAKGCEKFNMVWLGAKRYAFQSKHKRYISATPDGGIHAKAEKVGQCEQFTVNEISPGTYTITSSHGKMMGGDGKGNAFCDRTMLEECVLVRIHPYVLLEGCCHYFYSIHRKWLSAQQDGRLEWNRSAPKQWECFEIIRQGDKFAFRGWHNTYVTATSNGDLMCNAKRITEHELFGVRRVDEDKYVITAWNGKYITPKPDGSVMCKVDAIGKWEPIEVTARL